MGEYIEKMVEVPRWEQQFGEELVAMPQTQCVDSAVEVV